MDSPTIALYEEIPASISVSVLRSLCDSGVAHTALQGLSNIIERYSVGLTVPVL